MYAATGSKSKTLFWACVPGLTEIFGGLLAFALLGPMMS